MVEAMVFQVTCAVAAALLCPWGAQRLVVLAAACAALRKPRLLSTVPSTSGREPSVTVQIPLYNEPSVCVRVVDAACSLSWPNLEIQILDDSDDQTTALTADAVARWRASGVQVVHVRRGSRAGFKAGALGHGLKLARGEYIAIFDADFVPPTDFLQRAVPALEESGADMAQARWGHLNRDASWLTRAQAALLDAHFSVEQFGRAAAGRFFGFNGTAGVWRRRAIDDAGGWDARTLTEDLDLSLRAWFAGSRFIYLEDLVVPAELPTSIGSLRIQQHRWAKGAMQTARVRMRDLINLDRRPAEKLDIAMKLTQNLTFVLLGLLVLAVPLAAIERAGPSSLFGIEYIAVALAALPAFASVVFALLRCGRSPTQALVDALLAAGLAAALSAHAALAAMAGALGVGSNIFRRTPKTGGAGGRPLRRGIDALVLFEGAEGAVHVGVALVLGLVGTTPYLLLCGSALLSIVVLSLVEAFPRGAQR